MRAAFPAARVSRVEAGWEDAWRTFHRPVRVGPLWVGPPWEAPPAEALAVVVDPGRAFGTGAHATTRLCLELLLERERGSVLDAGCGSGVLAIAAAKLGHAPLRAADCEQAAVDAACANARANGVELDVRRLDVLADPLPPADLVLANIALAPLLALAPRLEAPQLVASGYLERDEAAPEGWERVERRVLDGWAADLLARR